MLDLEGVLIGDLIFQFLGLGWHFERIKSVFNGMF